MVGGWHVWPLLKSALCMPYLAPDPEPTSPPNRRFAFANLRTCMRAQIQRFRFELIGARDQHGRPPPTLDADAVMLPLSGRRVELDHRLWEIYSDPLVRLARELDCRLRVWESGAERVPRSTPSAWISRRIAAATAFRRLFSPNLPEPEWFGRFQSVAEPILGRRAHWPEISRLVGDVTTYAAIFASWLRDARARALFVVCWYDTLAMGATMAAKRLGLVTVELQHGIQGPTHFAYAGWQRAPKGGYEVLPDLFWCWGQANVDQLASLNPGFPPTVVALAGGNLWLNQWRDVRLDASASRPKTKAAPDRVVLVTLQLELDRVLLEGIAASPRNWTWLVRFHPARAPDGRRNDERLLLATRHPGLDLTRANESLVFQLLSDCDVHVTETSTVALEALGFGVRTIVIGQDGMIRFASFIEQGHMRSARTREELVLEITDTTRFDPEAEPLVSALFASQDTAREALAQILVRPRRESPQ